MEIEFRRIDFNNKDELLFIAKTDVTIPALFDSDFLTDELAIDKMLQALEKFTPQDFCEVGVNSKCKIVAYHIIKKMPYLSHFAGSIYTLWVDPEYRKQGIATEIKKRGEAWAKQSGLDHLYTWVHVDNSKMKKLNQDMGYEIVNYKMKKKLNDKQ
ncbi:MAG: GNAT family N-acetyltransferase [Bdellovibrio sp.]